MITRLIATVLAASTLSNCTTLPKREEGVVAKAKSIGPMPINRDKLLKTFGLEDRPSQRCGGSIRGGRMHFTETWTHASGLTIKAFDSEDVGHLEVVPGSIDGILNRPGSKPSNFIGAPEIGPPRQTFQGFLILRGDKTIFRSDEIHHKGITPNT